MNRNEAAIRAFFNGLLKLRPDPHDPNEVPLQGADSFGEVTLWIDMPDGTKIAQQRTSIPHLWTGVTSYLAVESLYRPERFLSQVPPIPK